MPDTKSFSSKALNVAGNLVAFTVINGLVQLFAYLGDGANDPLIGGKTEMTILQAAGVFAVGVQLIVFVPSYIFQTEHYFDLTGSLTYLSLALYTFFAGARASADGKGLEFSKRAIMVTTLVLFWAFRLGTFLFMRVKKVGKDGRFDELKKDFFRFLNVWTLQGLWVFLTAFPAFIINADQSEERDELLVSDYIGLIIWIIGMFIEALADHQKNTWRSFEEKKNPFIDYGLWNYSRHPNYFGEITLWIGVFIISLGSLDGRQFSAAFSPVFVFLLLNFLSGVPILEKSSDKRYGHLDTYWEYKRNTSVLVPLPKGWGGDKKSGMEKSSELNAN